MTYKVLSKSPSKIIIMQKSDHVNNHAYDAIFHHQDGIILTRFNNTGSRYIHIFYNTTISQSFLGKN